MTMWNTTMDMQERDKIVLSFTPEKYTMRARSIARKMRRNGIKVDAYDVRSSLTRLRIQGKTMWANKGCPKKWRRVSEA